MMNKDFSWKKVIDIVTIIILGAGVIVGYKAYIEYHKQNNAQMINSLLSSDIELDKIAMERPNLQGLFALPPINQDTKDIANKMLKIIIKDKNDNICNNWKDIPEL